jgi:hypothetical protein
MMSRRYNARRRRYHRLSSSSAFSLGNEIENWCCWMRNFEKVRHCRTGSRFAATRLPLCRPRRLVSTDSSFCPPLCRAFPTRPPKPCSFQATSYAQRPHSIISHNSPRSWLWIDLLSARPTPVQRLPACPPAPLEVTEWSIERGQAPEFQGVAKSLQHYL